MKYMCDILHTGDSGREAILWFNWDFSSSSSSSTGNWPKKLRYLHNGLRGQCQTFTIHNLSVAQGKQMLHWNIRKTWISLEHVGTTAIKLTGRSMTVSPVSNQRERNCNCSTRLTRSLLLPTQAIQLQPFLHGSLRLVWFPRHLISGT